MSRIWSLESRFAYILRVEKAVAFEQGELGLIPKKAARKIQSAEISVSKIQEKERETKHDITAFVSEAARGLGAAGAYIHHGLTSSDVLDTAFSLQLKDAGRVLLKKTFLKAEKELIRLIKAHKGTVCCGRTHGVHAEPTLFGFKLLGHLTALKRAKAVFRRAWDEALTGKTSGAVGAFSVLPPELEKRVCRKLGLKPELAATQVVPRDRHAFVLFSLGLTGAVIERLAVELRHLQRTEVGETEEGFSKGQTGSSAMPHKKNPILSENLTGAARLLRSYVAPGLENIALWHERDISHSGVERVVFPDAFILTHFALHRLANILGNLKVNKERMKSHLQLSQGRLFSSRLLSALTGKGVHREAAYQETQKLGFRLKPGESFRDQALKQFKGVLSEREIREIFSAEKHLKALEKRTETLLKQLKV